MSAVNTLVSISNGQLDSCFCAIIHLPFSSSLQHFLYLIVNAEIQSGRNHSLYYTGTDPLVQSSDTFSDHSLSKAVPHSVAREMLPVGLVVTIKALDL